MSRECCKECGRELGPEIEVEVKADLVFRCEKTFTVKARTPNEAKEKVKELAEEAAREMYEALEPEGIEESAVDGLSCDEDQFWSPKKRK
jgi:hypothetical protein